MGIRIQGSDLRNKDRIKLQDCVPLHSPLLSYIETSGVCNIHCQFCPTGDVRLMREVGRKQGIMSLETFSEVVAQMQDFPDKFKVVNVYKDGEPLLNPHLPYMVSALREANVAERILCKSNGLLLNPRLNAEIAACGLDMLGVSVIHVNTQGYKRVAGVDVDYEKFRDHVGDLFSRRGKMTMYVKIADVGLTEDEVFKFANDWGDRCDYFSVENLHGWSRTDKKDFTLGRRPDTFDGVPNKQKVVCPWTLYQESVCWDGTVQVCNEDWSHINTFGSIHDRRLIDIWNGDEVYQFRKMHLEGKRFDNAACGTCWQVMSQLDDVDEYRQQIMDRLENARQDPSQVDRDRV